MENVQKVFLLPGELNISKKPVEMSTILGSCVAVTLFNKRHKFGGMNHYMLPHNPAGGTANAKYGDYSINSLIKMMLAADPVKGNIQAMVLGGGHVVGHLNSGFGVADRNIAVAFEVLREHNIDIIKRDIGGDRGRKVVYKNWTNEVSVRKIEKSEFAKDAEKKAKHFEKNKIKVLVVDDSAVICNLLKNAINSYPSMEVVGIAGDPFEAREKILQLDPDVITLDIIMPKMDGITFLKKLMVFKPVPVIIISTVAQKDSVHRFRSQDIGAFDVIDKEDLSLYSDKQTVKNILIPKIEAAARARIKKKEIHEVKDI